MKRLLTHIIILTLTVLPVHIVSASAKNSGMKLDNTKVVKLEKVVQLEHECQHSSAGKIQKNTRMTMPCCDETSHQCDNCDKCSQVFSAISILPVSNLAEFHISLKTEKLQAYHLQLNGIPQQNLLRPPQNLV